MVINEGSTNHAPVIACDPLLSPSHLTDKELELSNQQLAAAVEELVLNSDQDQDAIDPAIVSLKKQSLPSPGSYGNHG